MSFTVSRMKTIQLNFKFIEAAHYLRYEICSHGHP